MDFRDKDGNPPPPWHDAESAFEAWKRCSAGRPCDYTGLSYARLRDSNGIQWPCNADNPDGTERLYADGQFWAKPSYCESFGRDLITGAPLEVTEYRAMNPDGRAMLKAAEYVPPHEVPFDDRPFVLITGRTLYQFHTRTKTGRAPQLHDAAPQPWVDMSAADSRRLGIGEGDLVEVTTARGSVTAPCRISGIRDGVVFVPFHYGYWDCDNETTGHHRAANELTITDWDPVSKQPIFNTAAAQVHKVRGAISAALGPTTVASAPIAAEVPDTVGGEPAEAGEVLAGGASR